MATLTRQLLRYSQEMSPADPGRPRLLFKDTTAGQNPPDPRHPYTDEKLNEVVDPGRPAVPANDCVHVIVSLLLDGKQIDVERFEATNTALQARAGARGASTWDETDVVAEYQAATGNTITLPA